MTFANEDGDLLDTLPNTESQKWIEDRFDARSSDKDVLSQDCLSIVWPGTAYLERVVNGKST